MGTTKVTDGDCMSSIAEAHGFRDYHSVYDDGANKNLKSKRPNPNALVIGDDVFLPDTKIKVEKKSTDKTWTFVVKKAHPVRLRIVIIDREDKPVSGRKWDLISPVAKSGTTGKNGLIDLEIPANAKAGELKLHVAAPPEPKTAAPAPAAGKVVYPPVIKPTDFKDPAIPPLKDGDEKWTLKIGSLPSPNALAGIQARLQNLGFRAVIESVAGPKTTAAVKAYQKKYKLVGSGQYTEIEADLTKRHDNP